MFDELAEELKNAREKNGMTLAQVANKSKIDIKFLEAMEQGDFAFLPELYVKAFVKSFAKTIGLDEEKIYKKFEAAKKGIPYIEEPSEYEKIIRNTEEPPTTQKQDTQTKDTDNTKTKIKNIFKFDALGDDGSSKKAASAVNKRNLILGGIFIAAIILLIITYFLFFNRDEQRIVVEKPIEEVISQNQRYIEDEKASSTSEPKIESSDSLILLINAIDTSWIKVSIDEKTPEEFILLPNSQKAVKAKDNYRITFGNSGAIKLLLNSKPLAFSGRNKSVRSVLIDKAGLKYQNNPPSPR
jgi:cytoskeletal protein RodZ